MNFWTFLTILSSVVVISAVVALRQDEKRRLIIGYLLFGGMFGLVTVFLAALTVSPKAVEDFSLGTPMSIIFIVFMIVAITYLWTKHFARVKDSTYPVDFKRSSKEAEAMRAINEARGWSIAALPADAMDPDTGKQFRPSKASDWRYASAWLADPNHKRTDTPWWG